MARGATQAHAIGGILDQLERAAREIGKSLDGMRGSVDYDRLGRARDSLGAVLGALDAVLAGKP
ncbi:MAG: hypothetical protein AB1578_13330 [Thermodesulfobacteriota bacterium]